MSPGAQPGTAIHLVGPGLLWLALLAAVLVAIGTLLSWVSVLFFSVNGIQTDDGKLVLAGAVGAAICMAVSIRSPAASGWYILGGLLGLASFGISLYDLIRVFTASHGDFFGASVGASPGVGLWLDVVAGAGLVAAVVRHWQGNR
jgi:hypothetical protein